MPNKYQQHIAQCNQLAQHSPDNLRRAVSFVLATIQQQLETVPDIMADFEQQGSASRFAFGSKATGLDWLQDNAGQLYRDAMAARDNPQQLLQVFLAVPGLGLVKSGFAAQLFAGTVGCIDTHNIKLYGIPLSAIRYGYPKRQQTIDSKLQKYIALCDGIGSSELWAAWCQHVAALRPANWQNGLAVSQLHVDCLAGRYMPADLFTGADFEPRYKRADY
jgi:hypothetical protein